MDQVEVMAEAIYASYCRFQPDEARRRWEKMVDAAKDQFRDEARAARDALVKAGFKIERVSK
jgi:plasmid stabilization system protein ParE